MLNRALWRRAASPRVSHHQAHVAATTTATTAVQQTVMTPVSSLPVGSKLAAAEAHIMKRSVPLPLQQRQQLQQQHQQCSLQRGVMPAHISDYSARTMVPTGSNTPTSLQQATANNTASGSAVSAGAARGSTDGSNGSDGGNVSSAAASLNMKAAATTSLPTSPPHHPVAGLFASARSLLHSSIGSPLQERMVSLSSAMTRQRAVVTLPAMRTGGVAASTPVTVSTNLSNIAGHSSFIMLALAYMESDVLMLRVCSAGGIVLSMLFQYYRAQKLWIPISWNALFLLINGGMIALLLSERREAARLEGDSDEAAVFHSMFARLGEQL